MSKQKEKYIFFDEMPDYLIRPQEGHGKKVNGRIKLGRCSILRRGLSKDNALFYILHTDMPKDCPRKKAELVDGSYTAADGEHFHCVGVMIHGFLYSLCFEEEKIYFGANVLNATRYIFLQTQKPLEQ